MEKRILIILVHILVPQLCTGWSRVTKLRYVTVNGIDIDRYADILWWSPGPVSVL